MSFQTGYLDLSLVPIVGDFFSHFIKWCQLGLMPSPHRIKYFSNSVLILSFIKYRFFLIDFLIHSSDLALCRPKRAKSDSFSLEFILNLIFVSSEPYFV